MLQREASTKSICTADNGSQAALNVVSTGNHCFAELTPIHKTPPTDLLFPIMRLRCTDDIDGKCREITREPTVYQ